MHLPSICLLAIVSFLSLPFSTASASLSSSFSSSSYSDPSSSSFPSPSLVASFRYLDFNFPNETQHQQYIQDQIYKSTILGGIKVWNPSSNSTSSSFPPPDPVIFLCINRGGSSLVPATLNTFSLSTGLLSAWPSWEANDVKNVSALRSVWGFEIDPYDRMWALDQGRIGGKKAEEGEVKLIIYSLVDATEIQRYIFPSSLIDPSTVFLNDIVVDTSLGKAYISNSGVPADSSLYTHTAGSIFVYDFSSNSAKQVLYRHYSTQAEANFIFSVGGMEVATAGRPFMTGADGIALSPDGKWLFWSPLTSRALYRVATEKLYIDRVTEADLEAAVQWLGSKPGNSDGMACTNWHESASDPDSSSSTSTDWYQLILTDLENDRVLSIKAPFGRSDATAILSSPNSVQMEVVAQNHTNMQWCDTLGFDNSGNGSLIFTTNKAQLIIASPPLMPFDDVNATNFHIFRVDLHAFSYLTAFSGTPIPSVNPDWIGGYPILVVVVLAIVMVAVGIAVRGQVKKEAGEIAAVEQGQAERRDSEEDERKQSLLTEDEKSQELSS